MMKKLRWAVDTGFWNLDVSTPVTIDGTARPVPDIPLPLGLSRSPTLSRHKQIDFMHKFMSLPLVPSYADHSSSIGEGFSLQRAISFPFGENWWTSLVLHLNLKKLMTSIRESALRESKRSRWHKNLLACLCDRSIYALGFFSELFAFPDSSITLSSESSRSGGTRVKAAFLQKLDRQNLLVEASLPGLYVDSLGMYWDIPLSLALDFASVSPSEGWSYHLCMEHKGGVPMQLAPVWHSLVPPIMLQPGSSIKSGFSLSRTAGIWWREEGKLRMVQPFDIFLFNPHISVSGTMGAVVCASYSDGSWKGSTYDWDKRLCWHKGKCCLATDCFGSISCSAQYGNFQKLLFDLSRLSFRIELPSGSALLRGIGHDVRHTNDSSHSNLSTVISKVSISFQQQILGPVSLRVDSYFNLKLNGGRIADFQMHESIFAFEYALKVLGSAKAVAWYSPNNREAMIELRFFER